MRKKKDRLNIKDLTNDEIEKLQEKSRMGEAGQYLFNIIRLHSRNNASSGIFHFGDDNISSDVMEAKESG